MKTILLNCLPPAMENCASPALSVLNIHYKIMDLKQMFYTGI